MSKNKIKIKMCGITKLEDALFAAELGVDALGFNFYTKSARYIEPREATAIIASLPPFIETTGVFVNESKDQVDAISALTGIDILQFHGDETAEYVRVFNKKTIKAFRVNQDFDSSIVTNYRVNAFLLDTLVEDAYGGSGKIFDWSLAHPVKRHGRIILSGGLNPINVSRAIEEVQPYAVDVSSGIEVTKGVKDHRKMVDFVREAGI